MQTRSLLVIAAVAPVLVLVVVRLLTAARGGDRPPPDVRTAAGSSAHATAPPMSAARSAPGSGSAEAPARPTVAPTTTVRLTPDDRRRLGEQIAAARQRARAADGAAGSADDDSIPVEKVSRELKDGLHGAIPLLAECFQQAPGGSTLRDAAALMTLTSDPELGTVIDTDEIQDAAGKPLAAKLDECVRDTIDSLALPPLGATGGKIKVTYTFKFD